MVLGVYSRSSRDPHAAHSVTEAVRPEGWHIILLDLHLVALEVGERVGLAIKVGQGERGRGLADGGGAQHGGREKAESGHTGAKEGGETSRIHGFFGMERF